MLVGLECVITNNSAGITFALFASSEINTENLRSNEYNSPDCLPLDPWTDSEGVGVQFANPAAFRFCDYLVAGVADL